MLTARGGPWGTIMFCRTDAHPLESKAWIEYIPGAKPAKILLPWLGPPFIEYWNGGLPFKTVTLILPLVAALQDGVSTTMEVERTLEPTRLTGRVLLQPPLSCTKIVYVFAARP